MSILLHILLSNDNKMLMCSQPSQRYAHGCLVLFVSKLKLIFTMVVGF